MWVVLPLLCAAAGLLGPPACGATDLYASSLGTGRGHRGNRASRGRLGPRRAGGGGAPGWGSGAGPFRGAGTRASAGGDPGGGNCVTEGVGSRGRSRRPSCMTRGAGGLGVQGPTGTGHCLECQRSLRPPRIHAQPGDLEDFDAPCQGEQGLSRLSSSSLGIPMGSLRVLL